MAGSLARWSDAGAGVRAPRRLRRRRQGVERTPALTDVDELVGNAPRQRNFVAAQSVVGITKLHVLGHRDGEFENDLVLREELVRVIRSVRPEVLVCPDPLAVFFGEGYFNHRDHRVVGWAALDAASPAASSPLYFPDAGAPFGVEVIYLSGSLEPNVYVDITATIERKTDAVLCHKTQVGEARGDASRGLCAERAEEAGRSVGVRFAEAFSPHQPRGLDVFDSPSATDIVHLDPRLFLRGR